LLHRNLVARAVFVTLRLMPPAPSDPDAVLMLRVKRGDRAAFETLVEKYRQPVMNVLVRSLPDAAEAEDLAQAVFVQVFKSAGRYEARAKFSTWLFTIARNLCLNELRRRARHPTEPLEPAGEAESDLPPRQFEDKSLFSPPDALLHGELEAKVREAIAALPENQRTALLLHQEEIAYEEISEVLDCSLSATKSLIHRARETLKARLKPYLRTGAWPEN